MFSCCVFVFIVFSFFVVFFFLSFPAARFWFSSSSVLLRYLFLKDFCYTHLSRFLFLSISFSVNKFLYFRFQSFTRCSSCLLYRLSFVCRCSIVRVHSDSLLFSGLREDQFLAFLLSTDLNSLSATFSFLCFLYFPHSL